MGVGVVWGVGGERMLVVGGGGVGKSMVGGGLKVMLGGGRGLE